MRIAAYEHEGAAGVGVVFGEEIAPLDVANVNDLLAAGPLDAGAMPYATTARVPLSSVRLRPPVRPSTFLGIGLNYASHAAETGRPAPEFPIVFAKVVTCLTGPYDPVVFPGITTQLDYEGELGVVMGAGGAIAGYVVVDDVSMRDWQRRTSQFTLGKGHATHGPVGPWLVTADELGTSPAVDLRTYVNGEVRQSSNTSDLVFGCDELVSTITQACTLLPGDLITTGTPSGVGMAMDPPRYLEPGDVVRVEVDGVGAIENRVVAPGEVP